MTIISDPVNGNAFPSEWDMNMMDSEEPFVLGSWLADQDPSSSGTLPDDDDDDFMMVDSDAYLFHESEEAPPTPPAGRLLLEEALEETLALAVQGEDDDDSFFTADGSDRSSHNSFPSPSSNFTSFLPLEQRYQATLEKLSESMKRSEETRKSLTIKTSKNVDYQRWSTVTGTLSSIEKSSQQLQQYLKTKKPNTQVL